MISIDDNGIIHIPVGHSLWVIDTLLRGQKSLSFPSFTDFCNKQAHDAGIIGEEGSIDESICQKAFDSGIERLKYLLKLNNQDGLVENPYGINIPNIKKTFQYQKDFSYRIFPETKYRNKEYKLGIIPKCKIDDITCVKFIDALLSSGKIFSTYALYSELEKEYCWIEFFVNNEDIVDSKDEEKIEKAELYRKCYSETLKQCLQRIDEYLIVKDMDELLISTPCPHYKKQFEYHYVVAGITVLNKDGDLPELTLYDRFKIYATKYLRSEIKRMIATRNNHDGYVSIADIESITDKIKCITDNIKEKQIASALKTNINIISEICTVKADGWQGQYINMLDQILNEFDNQGNKSESLVYADLLATYAQLLGKYGYDSDAAQDLKSRWFDTICRFYDEMISIAERRGSREREARFLIKYANFLRKENKYADLEEKYSTAINIYENIIQEKQSLELNRDYAYALRSYSKYLSDYDRISDAIEKLEKSLNYIDDYYPNAITDTYMQLSIRYAESGNTDKVTDVLNMALSKYAEMVRYNHNYHANLANVNIKLLRNIPPEYLKKLITSGAEIKYERNCLDHLKSYEELRTRKLNTNDKIYAHALTSLSLFYLDTNQKEKAIETCNKALEIHKLIRNSEEHYNVDIVNHHFYLGRALNLPAILRNDEELYESKDKIKLALDFYTKLDKELTDSDQSVPSIKKGLADTNLALAETLDYLNDIDNACKRYEEAKKLYSSLAENIQAKSKYNELLRKANGLLELINFRRPK